MLECVRCVMVISPEGRIDMPSSLCSFLPKYPWGKYESICYLEPGLNSRVNYAFQQCLAIGLGEGQLNSKLTTPCHKKLLLITETTAATPHVEAVTLFFKEEWH